VDFPLWWLTNQAFPTNDFGAFVYLDPLVGLYVFGGWLLPPNPGTGFPYGLAVDDSLLPI
jgi:hypothetical protein